MPACLAAALTFALAGVQAQEPAPAPAPAVGVLPLADVHFHAMLFMTPSDLLARMDALHVRWAGGAGAGGEPPAVPATLRDEQFLEALGERYIRSVGFGDVASGWMREKDAFFVNERSAAFAAAADKIDRYLKEGRARAIGEVHVNSRTSAPNPMFRRKVPADSPAMQRLMQISAAHAAPLSVHMQFDPDSVEQLDRLLAAHPNGVLVLAHCGKDTQPAQVRPLLQKHANLFCDLSYRAPPQEKNAGRIIFTRNGLDAQWKALIEEMPDRFMVGVDDVQSWVEYEEVVATIREGLLARLSPAAAEQVAYRNAVRLFRLQ